MGTGSTILSSTVVILVAIFVATSVLPKRQQIPSHLLGHDFVEKPTFFNEKMLEDLMQFTRDMGFIPTAGREYDSYKVITDNIGEAVPFNKTLGKCPKTYLMPNGDLSKCIFPGRTDVARHFVRTGGSEGVKEKYSTLISRIQPFQKIILNWTEHPVSRKLLQDKEFLDLAKAVCPKDKQYLDPFQFNMVVTLPGQTVATHLDAPYFQRASRFHMPQWLLATMVFSGLFEEDFISQVQVVGYYHQWKDMKGRDGNFKFWDTENPIPKEAVPVSGSANSIDGSKTVHAGSIYMKHRMPPNMPKNNVNVLRHRKGTKTWDVTSNDDVVATYDEDEIRFAVVYRARCFKDEAAVKQYKKDQDSPWTVEDVFKVFRKDLVARGLIVSEEAGAKMDPYDFGLLLMDTYVKYPMAPDVTIPYNYCAIDRVLPFMKPVVEAFCQ